MFDYTRAQILAALKQNHCVALAIREQSIRDVLTSPTMQNSLNSLSVAQKEYAERPIYSIPFSLFKQFEESGERTQYEYSELGYFVRRGHLKTWGISAILYDDAQFLTRLEDIIWAICDEYTWALPAHLSDTQDVYRHYQPNAYTIDIFAAETAQALAEILANVGDRLNPLVAQRARTELKKRVIDRFLEGNSQDFWWIECTHNWAAVCAGCIGMTGIYEIEGDEKLATLIDRTLISLRAFLRGLSDDGACLEGLGYWQYGFGYFAAYADLLYARTGGAINLFQEEKVKAVASFPTKTFFDGGRSVSFSDGQSNESVGGGIMEILQRHYPDLSVSTNVRLCDGVELNGCHRFALELRNLIFQGCVTRSETVDARIFPMPSAQWYLANGSGAFGFAAKAGNNAEPHNHNDLGHFIVYKQGDEFFADLGAGEYNKAYFQAERYDTWNCSSKGHSVPIINGEYQRAGSQARAEQVTVNERGIEMNLTAAYEKKSALHSYVRRFSFSPTPAKIVILDEFSFETLPKSLVERFITRQKPSVEKGKIILKTERGKVTLSFDPNAFTVTVTEREILSHDSHPSTFYTVDLTANNLQQKMSFAFVIE